MQEALQPHDFEKFPIFTSHFHTFDLLFMVKMAVKIKPQILIFFLTFYLVRGLKTGELQPITHIYDTWESVELHLILFSNQIWLWLSRFSWTNGADLLDFLILSRGLGSSLYRSAQPIHLWFINFTRFQFCVWVFKNTIAPGSCMVFNSQFSWYRYFYMFTVFNPCSLLIFLPVISFLCNLPWNVAWNAWAFQYDLTLSNKKGANRQGKESLDMNTTLRGMCKTLQNSMQTRLNCNY